MINEQNTLTKKCPKCGAPTQHDEITEACTLVNKAQPSVENILTACIKADAFQKFQSTGEGTDPCENCHHNQITVLPGTFLKMEDGPIENSWHEIHLCPACQTIYSIPTNSNNECNIDHKSPNLK